MFVDAVFSYLVGLSLTFSLQGNNPQPLTAEQIAANDRACELAAASPWEENVTEGVLASELAHHSIGLCRQALGTNPSPENVYRLARALHKFEAADESYELILQHRNSEYAPIQNYLGIMYYHGYGGLAANKNRAVDYYTRAAAQGFAPAQYNFGWMHYEGEGVETDYPVALGYFQQAATQEFPDAYLTLGYMYATGTGVVPSQRNAVIFYDAASKLGVGNSSYNLGLIEETAENFEMALHYFRLAEEQGTGPNVDVAAAIDRVETLMQSGSRALTSPTTTSNDRTSEITDMIVDEAIKFGVNQTLNYLFGGD